MVDGIVHAVVAMQEERTQAQFNRRACAGVRRQRVKEAHRRVRTGVKRPIERLTKAFELGYGLLNIHTPSLPQVLLMFKLKHATQFVQSPSVEDNVKFINPFLPERASSSEGEL